jgi:hypothetical protein
MSHAIQPSPVPPPRGLEKEEPDLWQEEDIPNDNKTGVDDDWQSPVAKKDE